jgi:uncharacterized protein (TIGR02145 family)
MKRLITLSAALILTMSACELTNPEPSNAETPRAFSDVYSEYIQALSDFQTSPNSEKADYRANASKVAPTDTIALLPADILPPKGTTVIWSHFNEMDVDTLDLSKSARVPLHDGINICVISDSIKFTECISRRMSSSLPAPILSIKGGQFDYTTDSIALTASRPGARIHYTLDGSYPEATAPVYQHKIPLDRPLFLRAYCELPGSTRSPSTVAVYTRADGMIPGIAYGSLLDNRDGQSYPTVQLGSRTWMAKNLNWKANDSTERSHLYGAKYTLPQIRANEPSAICPDGWHPSTKSDWDSLLAWGTRQPGVSFENIGNALQTDVFQAKASNQNVLDPADSDHVDLFGFRATTTTFWTSTIASDTTKAYLVNIQKGVVKITPSQSSYVLWGFDPSDPAREITEYNTNYVRCVKD